MSITSFKVKEAPIQNNQHRVINLTALGNENNLSSRKNTNQNKPKGQTKRQQMSQDIKKINLGVIQEFSRIKKP